MTPETQDNLEITPIREYPIYAGGRLLVGQVTKRTGMTVGTDHIHCRIEVPELLGTYPKEWFPITEIRSVTKLLKTLDESSNPHGLFLPKEILLDCYRSAWERLQHDIADLQMLRDEHQMDVMHAFQEGAEDERRKVAEWLRAVGEPRSRYYRMFGVCETAGEIERGVHLRKEKW